MLLRRSLAVVAQPNSSSQTLLCLKQWKHFALWRVGLSNEQPVFLQRSSAGDRPRYHKIKAAKHLAFWPCPQRASGGCLGTASARIPSPDVVYLQMSILAPMEGAINIYADISPLMRK